ncbi:MAG: bifunctional nuclease family protein [Bacteroidetes bacterium]|nr:bifunctional nuclease family protein [Bacteroidota bacterium]MBU1116288.1 bifunctional nuclease family protein [Bacteroidota bacterium]MBU1797136.1 bifunctional nuclease family protein [Bacteroidota bacterium]
MHKVQVEILGLSSSPSAGGAYALLLREVYGQRRLPIIIGQFEAQAIALELEGIKPPRPLTHDLLKTLVDNLGVTVLEVIIDELRDNTFYSKIVMDISSLQNSIDARPSDAIALAVRTLSPIYVAETVMQLASFIPSENDKRDIFTKDEDDRNDRNDRITDKDTKSASLQDQLRESIEKEDYERAAKLRDEIDRISGKNN